MTQTKVVIVGGGFGGLNAAQALKKAPVSILLVDKANYHLFQPLLYQVATSALSPVNIATPIRKILSRQKNASVLLADIVSIDKEKQEVIAANGEVFPYDYLILAPGARHAYFGHPEWETNAPGLKTLHDGLRIREQILLSYERAERCQDPEEAAQFMRFIIVGGGPTGVEMAGAIAEIAQQSIVRDFRHIKPEQTHIYLIEGGDRVLPSFPKDLSERAEKDLKKLKVDLILNSFVTDVTPHGVWMGGKFLASPNIIWAAGNAASPLLKTLNATLDKFGRIIVAPDLTVPNYPNIFVIGDAASATDKQGKPLPGIAPVAIQQGRYVAKVIKTGKRAPFQYFDKGMMATIGRAKAVATMGKLHLSGFFAWLAWCFVHVVYLISFSNRFFVMWEWFYLYLFNRRRIRLITRPITDSDDPL